MRYHAVCGPQFLAVVAISVTSSDVAGGTETY